MKPLNTLRLLLAAAFLLSIGAGALNAMTIDSLPDGAQESFRALLQAKAGFGQGFVVASAIYELALVAAIAGMMLRRRWGRTSTPVPLSC